MAAPKPLAIASFALCALLACEKEASNVPTETRQPEKLGAFDRVDVASALEVEITQGSEPEVRLAGAPEDLDQLVMETRGSTLHLYRRQGRRGHRAHRINITITMPTLRGVEVSGASDLSFKGFEGSKEFEVGASGASTVVGEMRGVKVDVDISGASDVHISGTASKCSLDASAASDADLRELQCSEWTVELSGASDARIYASHVLGPVDISGASSLHYRGSPQLGSVSVTGAASLDKG
jgi:hypothetical protein